MQWVDLATIRPETWEDPRVLIIYSTHEIDSLCIAKIRERHRELTILGCSSYQGVFSPKGYRRGSYGFLFEGSDELMIRTKLIDFEHSSDIRADTAKTVCEWCDSSVDELEFMIHSTPGIEELVLEGIHDACSQNIRIFGGSAGNDKFLEKPYVFLNNEVVTKGLLIIQPLTHRFECSIAMGGYLPTIHNGIVTKAVGRLIYEIDGQSAADVYDAWTDGLFSPYIRRGGTLPQSTALYPLGHKLKSEPEYGFWLSHPYAIDRESRAVKLFSTIPEDTRVTLMRGSERMLITRMGVVINDAFKNVDRSRVIAGHIHYCAGCASIVAENMESVCEQARLAFGDIPFIGLSSLGEQGRLEKAQLNYHGNMMLEVFLVLKN